MKTSENLTGMNFRKRRYEEDYPLLNSRWNDHVKLTIVIDVDLRVNFVPLSLWVFDAVFANDFRYMNMGADIVIYIIGVPLLITYMGRASSHICRL